MSAFIAGLALLAAAGVAALLVSARERWVSRVGTVGTVIGCLLASVPVVRALLGAAPAPLQLAWSAPGGSLSFAIDALSAIFMLPILLLGALGAIYAFAYLEGAASGRRLGVQWLAYDLLLASMLVVVAAGNGLLFLLAWEGMALSSYFLVNFDSERPDVRAAGHTYLIATHLGTAFLLVLFAVVGHAAGSLDFDHWTGPLPARGLLFLLALVGFGSKAGIVPVHVWLPEAHPAAPSHVSAVMSGAMIKTGIYGLLRFLTLLGPPDAWWGGLLVAIGLASGLLGVLFALAQHDLKRLLAYHSVENIGIILLGLGLGLLGVHFGLPRLAALGFAGALLHVVNHALFKGLLFLGAGAVLHATGTRDLDELGGLWRRMPWTGCCFLVGSAAICALPPLNGFVSEFLIYLGAFGAVGDPNSLVSASALVGVAGLALIGGLAAACFTKAFGSVFLGTARSEHAAEAHAAAGSMRVPMGVLAVLCAAIGLAPAVAVRLVSRAVAESTLLAGTDVGGALAEAMPALEAIAFAGAGLLFAALVLTVARVRLLRGRSVRSGPTWDCGYAQPTARMQYTASSFAQPIVDLASPLLRTDRREELPATVFPARAHFASETPDLFRRFGFDPLFRAVAALAARLSALQSGSAHLYVAYLVLTTLLLLLWGLGSA